MPARRPARELEPSLLLGLDVIQRLAAQIPRPPMASAVLRRPAGSASVREHVDGRKDQHADDNEQGDLAVAVVGYWVTVPVCPVAVRGQPADLRAFVRM